MEKFNMLGETISLFLAIGYNCVLSANVKTAVSVSMKILILTDSLLMNVFLN